MREEGLIHVGPRPDMIVLSSSPHVAAHHHHPHGAGGLKLDPAREKAIGGSAALCCKQGMTYARTMMRPEISKESCGSGKSAASSCADAGSLLSRRMSSSSSSTTTPQKAQSQNVGGRILRKVSTLARKLSLGGEGGGKSKTTLGSVLSDPPTPDSDVFIVCDAHGSSVSSLCHCINGGWCGSALCDHLCR